MTAIATPAVSTPSSPWRTTWPEWRDVLKRVWKEIGEDNIGLIAAGAAFYTFSAIIPLLAATVLTYGLVADAATVSANIQALFDLLPADAARLVSEQLTTVLHTSDGKKGVGLAVALAIALYGASKASSSMITALNIAYDEQERRGFVMLNLLALGLVAGGVVIALAAIATTSVLAFLGGLIPGAPGIVLAAIRLLGYLVLGLLVVSAAACLYRFAPDRRQPRWRWLSAGAVLASVLWLAGTAGFGIYVANFGGYGATYGSLSAVVVLLTWLWLSAYVFLLGAELNAELEAEATPGPGVPDTPAGTPGSAATASPTPRAGGKLPVAAAVLTGAGLIRLRRGSRIGLGLVAIAAGLAWKARRPDA